MLDAKCRAFRCVLGSLLRPNWSILRGTVSLRKMFENGKIAVFERKCRQLQILPKVCNERIFDRRQLIYNKIFLNFFFIEIGSSHLYAFFAPFASKSVNYSRHSETLNFWKNSKLTSFSFENSDFTVFKHFSKTH